MIIPLFKNLIQTKNFSRCPHMLKQSNFTLQNTKAIYNGKTSE